MPVALRCGVNFFDFWNMTVGEIRKCIDAYGANKEQELKSKKVEIYNSAALIASFVGRMLNSKHFPSYDEVFAESTNVESKEDEQKRIALLKERMLDFANEVNKRRKG